MTTPVPEEVYAAAAKAIHDRECADGTLCTATPTSMRRYAELGQRAAEAVWSLAFAAGRASIHAEWAQSLAEDHVADDRAHLEARAAALARQRVEAKVRAEVAAEIRASVPDVAEDVWTASAPWEREMCARIAEQQPKIITEEEK